MADEAAAKTDAPKTEATKPAVTPPPPPAPKPAPAPSPVVQEAKAVAIDVAETAIDKAVDDIAAKAGIPAFLSDQAKAWIRNEIELALQGHSPETRAIANP